MKSSPKYIFIATLFFCLFGISGCSTSSLQPEGENPSKSRIQLQDSLGRDIVLTEPAQRVVSLSPANTEILFFIGAGKQLVGRETFSDFPEEASRIQDIGDGMGGINLEAILAVEPDLILAGDLTPAEQVASLENVGLKVFVIPNPTNFSDLFNIIGMAATLTGHEKEAKALILELEARLSAIQEMVSKTQEKPLVFYEIDGTDPSAPWTAGPGSFIDMMITEAGGQNVGGSLKSEWAQISIEELILQDPDLILLGDTVWGGVTPESVALRPGWSSLSAIQNGRVYAFDDNLASRPGPRLIDGLEELARLFHPNLFAQ